MLLRGRNGNKKSHFELVSTQISYFRNFVIKIESMPKKKKSLANDKWKDSSLERLMGINVTPLKEGEHSHLVVTCTNLYKKQLQLFTIEDLRIMIGQDIGLKWLIPLAIAELEKNILASGNFYDGDLLKAVLKSKSEYWQDEPDNWLQMVNLMKQEKETLESHDTIDEIREEWRAAHEKFLEYTK